MLAKGKHFPPLPAPCPQSPFLTCSVPLFPKTACAIYFLTEKWFNVPSEFSTIFGIILKCKITLQPILPTCLAHTHSSYLTSAEDRVQASTKFSPDSKATMSYGSTGQN